MLVFLQPGPLLPLRLVVESAEHVAEGRHAYSGGRRGDEDFT